MKINLKKQLATHRLLMLIKNHDIVLFYTYRPTSDKVFSLKNFQKPHNTQGITNKVCCKHPQNFNVKNVLHIHNKSATQIFNDLLIFKNNENPENTKDLLPNEIGKSSKYLDIACKKKIIFYGNTLLLGCRKEEEINDVMSIAKKCQIGSLIGGFYKGMLVSRLVIKAHARKASNKIEVYTKCLKVLSQIYTQLLFFTNISNYKIIALLQKQKNLQEKNKIML